MKYEELLSDAINKPDFLCESGSHLYGTNVSGSDMDIRGFVMSPPPYLVGVVNFNCIELEEDTKIYSLKRFLELSLGGDPQCCELFFSNDNNIKRISSIGKMILSLKNDIISNSIYGRIMGYATSEWRKAMAIRLVPKKLEKEKKEIIQNIRNIWHPCKETMDVIIKKLEDIDDMKVVSSVSGLGVKRKKDVDEYGFCRKSASHSIRLLQQLKELMLTGHIIFPRPNADFLLGIRQGKYSKEELEGIHEEAVFETESARQKSILPDKSNKEKIWSIYFEMAMESLKNY